MKIRAFTTSRLSAIGITMPGNASVVAAEVAGNQIKVWAIVDDANATRTRNLLVVEDEEEIPAGHPYITTAVHPSGTAYHLIEAGES